MCFFDYDWNSPNNREALKTLHEILPEWQWEFFKEHSCLWVRGNKGGLYCVRPAYAAMNTVEADPQTGNFMNYRCLSVHDPTDARDGKPPIFHKFITEYLNIRADEAKYQRTSILQAAWFPNSNGGSGPDMSKMCGEELCMDVCSRAWAWTPPAPPARLLRPLPAKEPAAQIELIAVEKAMPPKRKEGERRLSHKEREKKRKWPFGA